ncbi:protein FAM210B, mitochondrial-like [Centruroides vittatus]|uniref:protein FAM210B, mitochondrial-like n=1 Tax=Centruroides vittatus TaxID=120091 RepID=UPI00350EFBC4
MTCLAIYSRSFRYLRLNNSLKAYDFYVKNKLNDPLKDFRIFPSQIRILSSKQDIQDKSKEVVHLSQKEKLKRAVKEYGSVVIVFHVGISLLSLGGFYLLVANGLDVVSLLKATRFAENLAESKVVMEGSTFVIAYAIHKLFAPVRIAITLSSSPLIVHYLRKKSIFRSPKTK